MMEEGIVTGPVFSVAPCENVIFYCRNPQLLASEIHSGEDE